MYLKEYICNPFVNNRLFPQFHFRKTFVFAFFSLSKANVGGFHVAKSLILSENIYHTAYQSSWLVVTFIGYHFAKIYNIFVIRFRVKNLFWREGNAKKSSHDSFSADLLIAKFVCSNVYDQYILIICVWMDSREICCLAQTSCVFSFCILQLRHFLARTFSKDLFAKLLRSFNGSFLCCHFLSFMFFSKFLDHKSRGLGNEFPLHANVIIMFQKCCFWAKSTNSTRAVIFPSRRKFSLFRYLLEK